ncbi:MAG: hypothetical protein ACYC56_08970 [Candidatus Aquicultor sp.]
MKFKIEAKGLPKPLIRDNMFFDDNDVAQSSFSELIDAITMLATNRFKKVTISTITVEADVTRARKAIRIDAIKVLDKKPAAGTVVKVEITILPGRKRTASMETGKPWLFRSECRAPSHRAPP